MGDALEPQIDHKGHDSMESEGIERFLQIFGKPLWGALERSLEMESTQYLAKSTQNTVRRNVGSSGEAKLKVQGNE